MIACEASTSTPIQPPTPDIIPTPTLSPTPTPQITALFSYARALHLLEIAEYEAAIPAFNLVIRKLPNFAQAYHGRGVAYYHQERLDLALEDFNKAIMIEPDYADAFSNRGILHKDQNKVQNAISDLEKSLALYIRDNETEKAANIRELLESIKRQNGLPR